MEKGIWELGTDKSFGALSEPTPFQIEPKSSQTFPKSVWDHLKMVLASS